MTRAPRSRGAFFVCGSFLGGCIDRVYIHPVVLSYRNKPKTEGRTVETVQMANTVNGFAIAITKAPNRVKAGHTVFSVVRVDRTNKFITLTNHDNEAAARRTANKYWLQDMGR